MMHFIWPDLLWLLLVWPLAVWGYWWALRRRRRQALVYSGLSLIRPALGRSHGWRRHAPPALLWLAGACCLLALARPTARVTLPADYMSLVLAMDVSRSMLAEDVPPSRIVAAQEAVRGFIKDLPTSARVGIVSFAGTAQLVQPITDDRNALLAAIDRFQLQRGTATGSGLLVALGTLLPKAALDIEAMVYGPGMGAGMGGGGGMAGARPLGQAAPSEPAADVRDMPVGSYTAGAIVLLSDGRRTTGPDPLEAARLAARKGVRVYTVAFGTPNGFIPGFEGFSFYARVDEEALQKVAEITGAEFFRATNATDLQRIYAHLSSQLTLEQRDTEVSALLIGAALLAVLLALGLSMRWQR
jgi:Ca-activated chloride channel family protein